MTSALELDKRVHAEIERLCALGDGYADKGQHQLAVTEYNTAWELIPAPRNEWEASTWVLAAIADSCFFLGKYTSVRQAVEYALTCPNGWGNPFLHLRLGQVCFEQNDLVQAAEHLTRAYMGTGEKIFSEQDPKYFEFLKTKIDIPT